MKVSTKRLVAPIVSILVIVLVATLFYVFSRGGDEDASKDGNFDEVADLMTDACPGTPIKVVVSINQWGKLASQLGGQCAEVTTILTGTDVEPHDFEPTPADLLPFTDAEVVIVNGAGYDNWALNANIPESAQLLNIAEISGVDEGENPHIWFSADTLELSVKAMSTAYKAVADVKSGPVFEYFQQDTNYLQNQLNDYRSKLENLKSYTSDKKYIATEAVITYFAKDADLVDITPEGYTNAITNESEPTPNDLQECLDLFSSEKVDFLFYNTQEASDITEKLSDEAKANNVPVIDVTEQVPEIYQNTIEWLIGLTNNILAYVDEGDASQPDPDFTGDHDE